MTSRLQIFEYPGPACEIVEKKLGRFIAIREPEDARAIRDSMNRFLDSLGGAYAYKQNSQNLQGA